MVKQIALAALLLGVMGSPRAPSFAQERTLPQANVDAIRVARSTPASRS